MDYNIFAAEQPPYRFVARPPFLVGLRQITLNINTISMRTFTHTCNLRILWFYMYIPNDSSTVVDIPFQLYNTVLASTGKLHLQTCIAISFSYDISCVLQAQVETAGGYNTTTHQTTTLLPRMLHSTLKTSEKLQSASYAVSLIVLKYIHMYMWVKQPTYDCNMHETTTTLQTIHLFYK